jgi:chromosome segregation ATPase
MTMATKTTTKLSDLENATKILNDLEAKAAELAETRASDERELEAISFEAHGAGDQKALARLETIKARAVKRELDAKSLDAAVAEAKRRVAEAKADEAKAEQHRVALEIQRLKKELREAGKLADEGLAMFLDATNVMQHIVSRFSTLGLGNPSAIQFVSLGERATRTVLMETAFKRAFEVLPPGQRQSFASFTAEWAVMLDKATATKLEQTKEGGANVAA